MADFCLYVHCKWYCTAAVVVSAYPLMFNKSISSTLSLYTLRNHPLWVLHITTPALNESRQLSTLHNPMVRTPAHTRLQPPLPIPLLISHPRRPPNRRNGDPTTRHQHRTRPLGARADRAYVRERERSARARHLARTQPTGCAPAQRGEVREPRRQRVGRVSIGAREGGRVEPRGRAERDADVCVRPHGERWFASVAIAIAGTAARRGGGDGRAEERPIAHGAREHLYEEGEIR